MQNGISLEQSNGDAYFNTKNERAGKVVGTIPQLAGRAGPLQRHSPPHVRR